MDFRPLLKGVVWGGWLTCNQYAEMIPDFLIYPQIIFKNYFTPFFGIFLFHKAFPPNLDFSGIGDLFFWSRESLCGFLFPWGWWLHFQGSVSSRALLLHLGARKLLCWSGKQFAVKEKKKKKKDLLFPFTISHPLISFLSFFQSRKYTAHISNIVVLSKEDLALKNHLSGLQKKYMKISFFNVQGLLKVRDELMPAIKANQARNTATDAYDDPTLNV